MADMEIVCEHSCGHVMERKLMRYSRSANRGSGGFVVTQDTDKRTPLEMARARKNTRAYWHGHLCLDCHARSPVS